MYFSALGQELSQGLLAWPTAHLPGTPSTCQPGPPEERFSIFSDLDAVKAHAYAQYKLGPT